jgi:hypothetical protein
MVETHSLPAGWDCVTETVEYEPFMDREYTTIIYEYGSSDLRVFINDVQEPNSFGGWGYLVHANDITHGDLGLVEDIESATELAIELMEEYSESR